MNPVSLMADASKLSVAQLQQSIKNGTVPAYIGIPLMQEKIKQAKQPVQAPQEPPIAQQVMAEASGIDQMPSNLPTQSMNDGGIVSFADGGDAEDFDQEAYEDQQDEAEYAQVIEDRLNAAEHGGGRPSVALNTSTNAAPVASSANINSTPNVEGGIRGVVNEAANKYGLPPELLQRISGSESGHNPRAKNSASSAEGLFQFIPSTWAGMGGKPGEQSDPVKNADLGGKFIRQNAETLKRQLGRNPNYDEVYAAHYFGPGVTAMLKNATSDMPIEQGLRMFNSEKFVPIIMQQNPNLRGKTVGQVMSSLREKMGEGQVSLAEGGIARLNKGGMPSFSGKTGSVPGYDAMGNYTGEVYSEEDTTPSNEPYKDNLEEGSGRGTRNIPGMITPAGAATGIFRQQRSIKPSVIGMPETDFFPQQDVSRVGFTPNAPSAMPSVQNYHPSDFLGETSGNPQSPLDFLGSASAKNTPFADDTTEADRLLRRYPAPKFKTNSTPTADNGASAGSTTGLTTGSTTKPPAGERRKSEYDLIREDIMNQREELKRQKQEDKYMAILQAGLGMMAGTSPNALANIGQGASAGIANYGASAKQRAAENAALNKGLLSAQRYQSMDDYQRAALADRAAGRADVIADRAEGRADTLTQQDKALMIRTEDNVSAGISRREKQIEDNIKGLFKMDAFGQFEPGQMEKYNQAVAKAKAEDNDLKKYHTRLGALQKSLYDLDYTMPNYEYSATSAPSGVTVRKVK